MVSVIVCTRNRGASLHKTLRALASVESSSAWELLIADNGSTDDTAAIVAGAASARMCTVRYLYEPRLGKSFALNKAITNAQGQYIAFTDDDALPGPEWWTALEAGFATGADWVFGPVTPRWESGGQPTWFCAELNGMFSLIDYGPDRLEVVDLSHAFNGTNCAARRTALDSLGGFRTDLGPTSDLGGGGEDTEMFRRALAAGHRILYSPDAVVEHVIPVARTTRAFHRRRILSSRRQAYCLAVANTWTGPRIGGVPRYYLGVALEELWQLIKTRLTGKRDLAFYHELRLLSFGAVFQQAMLSVLRLRRAGREVA